MSASPVYAQSSSASRPGRKIRVLVVDDSAIVRRILTDVLSKAPDLEVVGSAPDPYVARDKILALDPDVLTLDIEMPRMDGLTFLRKLMRFHPMPAVIVSSVAQKNCRAAVDAMAFGAVEVLAKPRGPYSVGELSQVLADKVRAAAMAKTAPIPAAEEPVPPALVRGSYTPGSVIAIGASTGGTEAIASLMMQVPEDSPPILIAQHIPPVFSCAFAERLNSSCALDVKEARDGDPVRPGVALVAPGDYHMLLRGAPGRYAVELSSGPRVSYQRPSVDVLFSSVAQSAAAHGTGVLLTGMGADGAEGLLQMRRAGAHTIAQDETTCAIFGMPREAIQRGAAERVLPLNQIACAMLAPA